jgi:hypothetical protein
MVNLLNLQEVLGSNTGRGAGYMYYGGFPWFSSTHPANSWESTSIGPQHSLQSNFQFVIHHSSY